MKPPITFTDDRPRIHIRPSSPAISIYGRGDGTSFNNAYAGLESVSRRVPRNSIVLIHGDHITAPLDFPFFMDKCLNHGVHLMGTGIRNRLGGQYEFQSLRGYDDVTVENLRLDNCAFRDFQLPGPSPHPPRRRSKRIKFKDCSFVGRPTKFCIELNLGNDDFVFTRCHFTGGTSGIYWVNRPGEGASGQRAIVERCTFENIGVKNNGRDNHGVGIQGSSDIVVKKSLFRNCAGDAIALWVGGGPQRNCHVLDNVIVGTRKPDPGFVGSSGRAITFSAAHNQQQYGNRTGCIVRGNWCDDIEGDCFSSAVWDEVIVEDNDFVQPNDEGEWVIQQFSFGAVPLDPRNNRTWVRDPLRLRSARLAYGFGNSTIPPTNLAALHQSNQIGNIVDRPKQPTDVGDKS